MNKYFIISIDTESDWTSQKKIFLENIVGVHSLQKLCKKYSFIPTYLITYEVAKDYNSIKILDTYHQKELCEIGSHLHVWTTPPFDKLNKDGIDFKWYHAFQSELSDDMLYEKLEILGKTINESFGIHPMSHRAGRWGIDCRTLLWLGKNGYLVDSSICSRKTWKLTRGVKGFLDYDSFNIDSQPYFPSSNNILKKSENKAATDKVLEVPVSNLELNFFKNTDSKNIAMISTVLNKLGIYYTGNISLRPSYDIPLRRFEKLVDILFQKKCQFVNFMMHSNELTLGTSPYSRTKRKHIDLMKRADIVFKAAKKHGYMGIKLSDCSKIF